MNKLLKVAIVGAGPSGLYSADHLLNATDFDVRVDIIDRMPTPWGLVRYGVAPDHPEKKQITDRRFEAVIRHPLVRFIGNVEIGKDVTHEDLSSAYHAVIYAIGSADDRHLGIPGEDLQGCWGAREFVGWYNGHPDYSDLKFDLTSERAVIIGNGNVALDMARILVTQVEELRRSDIADYALEALHKSRIKEVLILGRRGTQQAAFHSQMLQEFTTLPGVDIRLKGDDDLIHPGQPGYEDLDWETGMKMQVLSAIKANESSNCKGDKLITLGFLRSPALVIGNDRVESLETVANRLQQEAGGKMAAVPTDEKQEISTGLIFRSIGYLGRPLSGLPFDQAKGIIENNAGRVQAGNHEGPGVYVTGWARRGPSGVIGSNRKCAGETVDSLLSDAQDGLLNQFVEISDIWKNQKLKTVSLQGWQKIDAYERQQGRSQQRPRIKLTNRAALLNCTAGMAER